MYELELSPLEATPSSIATDCICVRCRKIQCDDATAGGIDREVWGGKKAGQAIFDDLLGLESVEPRKQVFLGSGAAL
jgi:hypothetical protein